ncbi:adenosylhomocysteinase [Rarobacter incanus]|uniref:Adenosylhomocysteinase n=1 Tax=Rarobacter incanus TaxID=153494 RepID=A0A542SPV7_9MICO|nr:adenosylhomocysteinase [Rarobacter incanus]TQK76653.1 adenosylhomocysteinase [Rarobacter incanus]
MPNHISPEQWAQVVLRRYAAATNLLIASRHFAIADPRDANLESLAAAMRAIGARVTWVDPSEPCEERSFHALFGYDLPATGCPGVDVTVSVAPAAAGSPIPAGESKTVDVTVRDEAGAVLTRPTGADGTARIAWARRHMPVTAAIENRLTESRALRGWRIGMSLVLEPKTAVLALALARAGALVSVFGHPAETRDDVADALRKQGLAVFADSRATPAQAAQLADQYLRRGHDLLIDDGSHLIRRAHELPDVLDQLRGAAEETTSGLRPLRAWAEQDRLGIPVIAVNDARSKTLFDNAYGTGQSCLLTIMDLVDPDHRGIDMSQTTITVIGYGDVGRGFAHHARALGATVHVSEIDPVRALQARFDGYEVGDTAELATRTDWIVSATGVRDTINVAVLQAAKDGAVLAVAGGVDQEISIEDARTAGFTNRQVRPRVKQWSRPAGGELVLLDDGECINVTAGEGNPIEIMDLSFAVQLRAIEALVSTDAPTAPGVYPLSAQADNDVAAAALITGESGSWTGAARATPGDETQSAPPSPAPLHVAERKSAIAREYGVALGTERSNPSLVNVYSAALVIPVTAPAVIGGAVAVRGGRIMHVGERDWVVKTLRETGQAFTERHWPGVLLPGLVNAHTHLQYTSMVEVASRTYAGFDDWAQAFNVVYDNGVHDWGAHAADGARQAIRFGTTAAADVVTDPEAAPALHDAGLHGVAYWEVMGWTNEEWAKYGETQTLAALDSMPTPPMVGLSPHAPYSLDTAPLLEIPDLVRRRGLRLHIHLAESQLEAQWAQQSSGSLADLWRSGQSQSFRVLRDNGFGMSATEFVDQLGVLGPDCHVAHGVYMTAWDRSLLRARATSVALCPRSNQIIGLDAPPVAAYLNEGNPIAVGTDSLSSSPSLDLLADVALLYELARAQGYERDDLGRRLLYAATLGGATALGLSAGPDRIGQLQTGAVADMVFLDIPVSDIFGTIEDVVRHGAGSQVATMISGELRYMDAVFNQASR